MFNTVIGLFKNYMGEGFMVICFLVAEGFLIYKEKNKARRALLIYTPLTFLAIYFCPLFSKVYFSLIDKETYFRVLWLIPWTLVVVVAMIKGMEYFKEKYRLIYGLIMLLIIVLSGKIVYSNPLFSRAQNEEHLPQYVLDVCDEIIIPGREVMAVFPEEFVLYVRQYTPLVCQAYGRDELTFRSDICIEINKNKINCEKLCSLSKESNCHYIIVSAEKEKIGSFEENGFEYVTTVDGYEIYKNPLMNYDNFIS